MTIYPTNQSQTGNQGGHGNGKHEHASFDPRSMVKDTTENDTASRVSGVNDGRKSTLVRSLVLAVLGVVVLGGGGLALWNYPFVSDGIAQSSASQKKSRSASESKGAQNNASLFLRHASEGEVQTCKDTYVALGEALVAGSQYMVQTDTAQQAPNDHSVQGLVGLHYNTQGDYQGSAAGLVFAAPTPSGGNCEGTMVRVVPFAQSCQQAASLLPQGSRQGRALAGVYTFALPNGGNAMLLPSASGCVVLSVVRGAA